jgi:hypothetical protein
MHGTSLYAIIICFSRMWTTSCLPFMFFKIRQLCLSSHFLTVAFLNIISDCHMFPPLPHMKDMYK